MLKRWAIAQLDANANRATDGGTSQERPVAMADFGSEHLTIGVYLPHRAANRERGRESRQIDPIGPNLP